jgi:divalent metal cation (Fe/Co/Zn/Cd) transporter
MVEHKMKPIWFFVGLILIAMGGIIFLSGIYQFIKPPEVKTVLAETNPAIWWGAIMFVFGGVMYWKTRKETI